MSPDLDDKELGRRLSAGRGYVREEVKEFAERINENRADLRKWELGNFGSPLRPNRRAEKREKAVRKVREASGLPASFFKVDFNDLDAMVERWERCKGGHEPPEPGPATDVIPPRDR